MWRNLDYDDNANIEESVLLKEVSDNTDYSGDLKCDICDYICTKCVILKKHKNTKQHNNEAGKSNEQNFWKVRSLLSFDQGHLDLQSPLKKAWRLKQISLGEQGKQWNYHCKRKWAIFEFNM